MAPVGSNVRENGRSDGCLMSYRTFHTQLNIYRDLALFLQLYNGNPWVRRTGVGFTSGIGVTIACYILVL